MLVSGLHTEHLAFIIGCAFSDTVSGIHRVAPVS